MFLRYAMIGGGYNEKISDNDCYNNDACWVCFRETN